VKGRNWAMDRDVVLCNFQLFFDSLSRLLVLVFDEERKKSTTDRTVFVVSFVMDVGWGSKKDFSKRD